jgi:hypothetical protein
MKVKLKTIEQIKEEAIRDGHVVDDSYDINFTPYRGLITKEMIPSFGKEIKVEKTLGNEKYHYVTYITGSGRRYIREDWIDHVPNFVKEISSIFDSILEDL